jgi:hypothetical protein
VKKKSLVTNLCPRWQSRPSSGRQRKDPCVHGRDAPWKHPQARHGSRKKVCHRPRQTGRERHPLIHQHLIDWSVRDSTIEAGQPTASHVIAAKTRNRSSRVLDVSAHAHSNTITLGGVSGIRTLVSPRSTNLGSTIDVEVGEGSVSERRWRRGQGRKEHRLSLHLGWQVMC